MRSDLEFLAEVLVTVFLAAVVGECPNQKLNQADFLRLPAVPSVSSLSC